MEVHAVSTDSTPSLSRLRVTRNASVFRNHTGGGEGLQVFPPRLAKPNHRSSHGAVQLTSDDDSGLGDYNGPNSRLLSASLPPPDNSVQATDTTSRLRALLERFDANSRTPMMSSRVTLPPTPSEPDSDFDLQPAQAARVSVQSIFDDALREPGDTPQKQRITRRASFNEIGSPKIGPTARKSGSDEEKGLIPREHDDHSFTKETSVLEPSGALSTTRSNVSSYFARRINQHSPLNHPKSHKDLEPFEPIEDRHSSLPHFESRLESSKGPSGNLSSIQSISQKLPSRTNEADNDYSQQSEHRPGDGRELSLSSQAMRTHKVVEALHPSALVNTGRTSPGAWPTPPPRGSSPNSITLRKHTNASPATSVTSDADYRDRLGEIQREHQHTLERNWNRPQQHHAHSTPHLHVHRHDSSAHSSGSSSGGELRGDVHTRPRFKVHAQPARSASPSLSTSSRHHHQRATDGHSLTKAERSQRPRGVAHDGEIDRERRSSSSASTINVHSHSAVKGHRDAASVSPASSTSFDEKEEEAEELHKRERNRNAPRPKWKHQHSQHHSHEVLVSHMYGASEEKELEHASDTLKISSHGHRHRPVSPSGSHPRSELPALQMQASNDQTSCLPGATSMMLNHHASITRSNSSSPPSQTFQPNSSQHSGHSLVNSYLNVVEDEEVTIPSEHSIERHRRTSIEPPEPTSPFSHLSTTSPSVIIPDDSTGSLFANESVPPPRMSTPTFKANHLPDLTISPVPSDVPLPPSRSPSPPLSPNRDRRSRANVDIARLQRAVAPNFTFPSRHSFPASPDPSEPTPSRVSPPPGPAKSPSPPAELPKLPDRPSSEDVGSNHTPMRPALGNKLSALRTPRFPGAYGTPYKAPPSPASATPLPLGDECATYDEQRHALPASSTSTTTVATPAPPGAYQLTPAIKLKGIRKVRFDNDADDEQKTGGRTGGSELINGPISQVKESGPPPSPSSDEVPINSSPTRNKPLRLVDEYGRARMFTEDGQEIKLHRKGEATSTSKTPIVDNVTMTPRRRAKIRQVDEFGNELISTAASSSTQTEQPEELTRDVPQTKHKKAVFNHLAKSLGELNRDLAKEEDALAKFLPSEGRRDNGRLEDLVSASDAARIEREKLSRKLELERLAVNEKTFIARNQSRDLAVASRGKWWQRKWRLIIIGIIIELIFLLMVYKFASLHAKHLWLKTYFDPFFPALYSHPSRPGFLERLKPLPMEWSVFVVSDTVRTESVIGVGKKVWEEFMGWRSEPW